MKEEKKKRNEDWNSILMQYKKLRENKGNDLFLYTVEERELLDKYLSGRIDAINNDYHVPQPIDEYPIIKSSNIMCKFIYLFYKQVNHHAKKYLSYAQVAELYCFCSNKANSREHISRRLSVLCKEGLIKKINPPKAQNKPNGRKPRYYFTKIDDQLKINEMMKLITMKIEAKKEKAKEGLQNGKGTLNK